MKIKYYIVYLVSILIRFIPWPAKTGLIKIGNPNRNSPIIVTGNYKLTVEIVKNALKGIDAYLLIADSKGINIWCAATGGYFTNHSIISILKTSGINELVDKKEFILPQLAATGIELNVIHKKTGWKGYWGPIDAKDLPIFINNNYSIDSSRRRVKFDFLNRLEIAIALWFVISVFVGIFIYFIDREYLLISISLVLLQSLLLLILFPYYINWLNKQSKYKISIFELKRLILQFSLIMISYLYVQIINITYIGIGFYPTGLILSIIITLTLTIDLMGVTPVYRSDLSDERLFNIKLNTDNCKGAGFCEIVCPRGCIQFNSDIKLAKIINNQACVQCGACIVQCPFDALYLENEKNEVLTPETIRKYRLNMSGKRTIEI